MKAIDLLGLLLSAAPQPPPQAPPQAGGLDRAKLSDRSAVLLGRLAQAALAGGADQLEDLLDTLLGGEVYAELCMTFTKVGGAEQGGDADSDLARARALTRELAGLYERLPGPALRSAADDANLYARVSAALADPKLPAPIHDRLRASLLAGLASMLDAATSAPEAPAALADLIDDFEALAPRWLAWAQASFELALAAASWVRPGLVFELDREAFANEAVFLAVAAYVDDHPDCPGAAILGLPAQTDAAALEQSQACAAALRASPRLRTTD